MIMSKYSRIYGTGKNEELYIQFEADREHLLGSYKEYVDYVKGCEHTVRKDDRYTKYIGKIRAAGYDRCAILADVTSKGDGVKLEMHHGPIFNLFDICDIVLKAVLKNKDKYPSVTTYLIGDLVLAEHERDNIQIVMLSKTAHRGGHFGLFIDIKATIGRIDRFIDRWNDGMEPEHYEYIERYIQACKDAEGKSIDNELFNTSDKLVKFKK